MNKLEVINLIREQKIRAARESFWEFCKIMSPTLDNGVKLYSEDTIYLKDLANTLQKVVENQFYTENGDIAKGVCISLPPRHGKSYTVNLFSKWYLGKYENRRIINISYSQKLTNQFSREIRNEIKQGTKGAFDKITFTDIFPNLKISNDQKSAEKWALENTTHSFTFATASFRTSITGLGADLGILDDPIKNSEEAMSEKVLEDKWDLFTNTFISRVEQSGKWIIIQTRWSKDDIIGKLKEHEVWSQKFNFIELKAVEETKDGLKFLNENIFNEEEYILKKSIISDMIFEANYNQKIIDLQINLYSKWKTWTEIPNGKFQTVAVLDPSADGKDYTAAIVGKLHENGNIYLQDIFYNAEDITKIQDDLVDFLVKNKIDRLIIESNSAFIILADNIKKEFRKKGINNIKIETFKQTKNKEARILTSANAVQEFIYFMPSFKTEYKEVYEHFIRFKSIIKDNIHDDFEDCLTLMFEKFIFKGKTNSIKTSDKKFFI